MQRFSAVVGMMLIVSACSSGGSTPADASPPPTTAAPTAAALPTTTVPAPTTTAVDTSANVALAEAFIDAFYSFDSARLEPMLANAATTRPIISFFQLYAAGANFTVVDRQPCEAQNATFVKCSVTSEDDFTKALMLNDLVTDTFSLSIRDGEIRQINNFSDVSDLNGQALDWVFEQNPELTTGACAGYFFGGPTPGDCAREVVAGFKAFVDQNS